VVRRGSFRRGADGLLLRGLAHESVDSCLVEQIVRALTCDVEVHSVGVHGSIPEISGVDTGGRTSDLMLQLAALGEPPQEAKAGHGRLPWRLAKHLKI
jgi:hypothetical protein